MPLWSSPAYLLVGCLFNDVVRSSNYIASSGCMISERLIGEDVEGKSGGII
jgi:hypothetical protein